MDGFLGATDSAVSRSGREASKPTRKGAEMSGTRAAAAVDECAEVEKAEGKKRMLLPQRDLCSQSRECRDQRATARVCARRTRSLRSGVLRSGLAMRACRVELLAAGAL